MAEGEHARRTTLFGSHFAWSFVVFVWGVARWTFVIVVGVVLALIEALALARGEQFSVTASDVAWSVTVGVLAAGAKVFHDLRMENLRLGVRAPSDETAEIAKLLIRGDLIVRQVRECAGLVRTEKASGITEGAEFRRQVKDLALHLNAASPARELGDELPPDVAHAWDEPEQFDAYADEVESALQTVRKRAGL